MADADITILDKDGVARKIDTRTVGAGGDEHREVFCVGDHSTFGNVLGVDSSGRITTLAVMVDASVTASLTATDALGGAPAGTGALISTAPTAGSFISLAVPGGGSQVDVMILGTATGTYYFEHSLNSTNGSDGAWIATNFRQTGIVNTVLGYSTTTIGVFRGNSAGFNWVRVRNVGGSSPTNAITIRITNGSGTTFLNASIPAGSNTIGAVNLAGSGTAVDVALASAATSAQVLAANTARRGLLLTNTDANAVYVYYGTTATATKFTVKIPGGGGYWEMPQPAWTGRIDAIWAADGSGSLVGSELS